MSEKTEASAEKAHVLKSVEGRTLTFRDGSTLDVDGGVHVKLDGNTASLADLKAGDRCECCTEDGKPESQLVVVKVRREVPDGFDASTSPDFPKGKDREKEKADAAKAEKAAAK